MPSRSRSRKLRCLLGPGPADSGLFSVEDADELMLKMDSFVGLACVSLMLCVGDELYLKLLPVLLSGDGCLGEWSRLGDEVAIAHAKFTLIALIA